MGRRRKILVCAGAAAVAGGAALEVRPGAALLDEVEQVIRGHVGEVVGDIADGLDSAAVGRASASGDAKPAPASAHAEPASGRYSQDECLEELAKRTAPGAEPRMFEVAKTVARRFRIPDDEAVGMTIDAAIHLCTREPKPERSEDLGGLLWTAATRRAIDRWRRDTRFRVEPLPSEDVGLITLDGDAIERRTIARETLLKCLGGMSHDQFDVVLSRSNGEDWATIGRRRGTSPDGARKLFQRAVARCRDR